MQQILPQQWRSIILVQVNASANKSMSHINNLHCIGQLYTCFIIQFSFRTIGFTRKFNPLQTILMKCFLYYMHSDDCCTSKSLIKPHCANWRERILENPVKTSLLNMGYYFRKVIELLLFNSFQDNVNNWNFFQREFSEEMLFLSFNNKKYHKCINFTRLLG